MKRFITTMCTGLLVTACSFALGQTQTTGSGAAQQTQTAPPAQSAPPQTQAPAKKGPPQAKTQEEYAAYNTATGQTDLAAAETAANDFAKKFPDSDLRSLLYGQLMQKYYSQNQADKTIEMGRKVLTLDPGSSLAAAMTSTALAESTRETDLDRDEKYAEALRDAESAVKNIDNIVFPANYTPQQISDTKNDILALAHSSMGYVEMARKNYGISEQHLKDALAISSSQPDPTNYLRLAVVQDNQKKYAEAMVSADKAISLAQAQNNAPLANMAKNEKDRLTKLSAGSPPPPKPVTPAPQPTPPKQ